MRTLCIWHLQYLKSFRNGCLFCTFWLIRNFYSGEAHHANYDKHSLNHHFLHCAQCVYEIYIVFEVLKIAVCFAHFGIFEIWTALILPYQLWWTLFKSSFPTLRTVCIWDLQCFQSFRNCCLFCTFWVIRNFYSGHEQQVNYGKHSLNDHYQHCAHCVYDIYRIFTVFEMGVCFAHFGIFEIRTALILTILAMVNVVQFIISNIAQLCIWDIQCFQSFRNCCLFCTFWLIRNFYSGAAHHANYSKHSLSHHFKHCAQCEYAT